MAHVSEEMIEAFEADGVILLKNVFHESWLDRLAAPSMATITLSSGEHKPTYPPSG